MHRTIKVQLAVVIAAAMSLIIGAGTASAATASVQSRFATQAHAAGLSAAQAGYLQQEATSYIREHGGTQAALNVVDFPGGKITFVVPGEKYARDLATQPRVISVAGCTGNAFCAYEGINYTGSEISVFENCEFATILWKTEGSYYNQLPTDTQAFWYDANFNLKYTTPASPSHNLEVNWAPVMYILSC
jgi:hypothetical protein